MLGLCWVVIYIDIQLTDICHSFVRRTQDRLIMRRAIKASLFSLGFPRSKKPLHNGSYEYRVPEKKKTKHYAVLCVGVWVFVWVWVFVCVCDSTS